MQFNRIKFGVFFCSLTNGVWEKLHDQKREKESEFYGTEMDREKGRRI